MSAIHEIDVEDLRDKVQARLQVKGTDECWPWTGASTRPQRGEPYGKLSIRIGPRRENRTVSFLAHRLVYLLHYSSLEDNEKVLHQCSNAICCNPHHLYIGSHQQNMNDMVEAGNSPAGENNPRSKLTTKQVNEIRSIPKSLWWSSSNRHGWTLKKLAERYNVSIATISLIRRGTTWRPARESNSSHLSDNQAASPEAQRGA